MCGTTFPIFMRYISIRFVSVILYACCVQGRHTVIIASFSVLHDYISSSGNQTFLTLSARATVDRTVLAKVRHMALGVNSLNIAALNGQLARVPVHRKPYFIV